MSRADTPWKGEVGWAVWVGDRRGGRCVAVLAETQSGAERKALEESDYDVVRHVDGPFQNAEPSYWEFEFVTEHRERVVVEAPCESYAEESADAERDYRGEYMETIHTTSRRIPKESGNESEADQ